MEPASGAFHIPAAVQNAGIDEESLSAAQEHFFIACGHKTASGGDEDGFQLLMPVPGNVHHAKIIVVAGDGKGGGAVFNQLPAALIRGGIAF